MVSQLVVACYDSKLKADEALLDMLKLGQANLAHFEDAVVVIKNADSSIRVKAYHDLVEPVPELGNDLWGGIISGIVFHRSLGIHPEQFDGTFLTEFEDSMQPNSSALFLLVPDAELETVVNKLSQTNGTLLKTSLSDSFQAHLQATVTEQT